MFSHFVRKLQIVAGWIVRSPGHGTVTAGGLRWTMTPAGEQLFGPGGPDLEGWLKSGHAEVMKENLQRTILRVSLPGGSIFVKRCRANTPRSWMRELLRPAKAQLEFENAEALQKLGVSTIEPLAWGGRSRIWPGESILITRDQSTAEPLLDLLMTLNQRTAPAAQSAIARQLSRGLAQFLARMHDAGVAHPDPHPGNFLVELPASRVPHFVLIDLHAVHFGPPLTWSETRENLTLFNRWFQLRGTRTHRWRFWRAYTHARTTLELNRDSAKLARELEDATIRSNNHFWTDRQARHLTNNRDSKRVTGSAAKGYAVRSFDLALLKRWLSNPDAIFREPGITLLKDSRTSTVARTVATIDGQEQPIIIKRFRLKGRLPWVKNLLRPSPARRSWVIGNNLLDRGLPTAQPLAFFERRTLGIPGTGYVAFAFVPDTVELSEAIATLGPHQESVKRVWIDRLARLIQLMHDREVAHRDLKAANILLSGSTPESMIPVLIDLVGVTVGKPVPDAIRQRDLARLNASFLQGTTIRHTDRLRFLRTYLRWGLQGREGWKVWWKAVAEATAVKVAKNQRTGRPLA